MGTGDSTALPSANYTVVRVRRDVAERSTVGAIFTNADLTAVGNQAYGADANIWVSDNILMSGFWAATRRTEAAAYASAHQLSFDYQTDPWGLTVYEKAVDEGFDPAIGFVRRQDVRDLTGKLRRRYRANKAWSRTLDVTASMTYLTDLDGRLLTRLGSFQARNSCPSGTRLTFDFERELEQLTEDFKIHHGVVIPLAVYRNSRYVLSWSSEQGRQIAATARFSAGNFFGGSRQDLRATSLIHLSRHLSVEPEYRRSWVQLPGGDFVTDITRVRAQFNWTPDFGLSGLLQWNSVTREYSANVVLRILYRRDSSVYLVFSERRNDSPEGWFLGQRAAIFKITYRVYI